MTRQGCVSARALSRSAPRLRSTEKKSVAERASGISAGHHSSHTALHHRLAPATSPCGDVGTQHGCFVVGTHVSPKGHSVTTSPASWTPQTRCHVTEKSKHSLPCTSRVAPIPQGKDLIRDCQRGLRVISDRNHCGSRRVLPGST